LSYFTVELFVSLFFFILIAQPPTSTLFPYTTLFRSRRSNRGAGRAPRTARSTPRLPNAGRRRRVARPRAACRRATARDRTISHRSEEHTSELQSQSNLVCRLLLEKKKNTKYHTPYQ